MLFGPARAASSDLTVIYVGGGDCPPCTRWKTTQKPRWLASPEFPKVTWVEVESPKLKDAYQERYWPADLRPVLAQLPRKTGTPRFLIVQRRQGRVQRIRQRPVGGDHGRPQETFGRIEWRAPSTAWWSST